MAVVKNYRKSDVLAQWKCILSQFWSQKFGFSIPGLKSRHWHDYAPSRSSREESVAHLFQLLVATSFLWLWQHYSHLCLHGHKASVSFLCVISFGLSPVRIHVTALSTHPDNLRITPTPTSLITFAKTLFPNIIPLIRMWMSSRWGLLFQPTLNTIIFNLLFLQKNNRSLEKVSQFLRIGLNSLNE